MSIVSKTVDAARTKANFIVTKRKRQKNLHLLLSKRDVILEKLTVMADKVRLILLIKKFVF